MAVVHEAATRRASARASALFIQISILRLDTRRVAILDGLVSCFKADSKFGHAVSDRSSDDQQDVRVAIGPYLGQYAASGTDPPIGTKVANPIGDASLRSELTRRLIPPKRKPEYLPFAKADLPFRIQSFGWASHCRAKSDPAEARLARRRTPVPDGIRTNLISRHIHPNATSAILRTSTGSDRKAAGLATRPLLHFPMHEHQSRQHRLRTSQREVSRSLLHGDGFAKRVGLFVR